MTSMDTALKKPVNSRKKNVFFIPGVLACAGFLFFTFMAVSAHPEKAWLAFLTNFMFFTCLSAGGLLFSTLMHFTKAKWSHRLAGVAEAFSAFFPVSFILFIILLIGQEHVFTWLHEDLHGKEIWLNVPFLMARDGVGFLILYALGFGYLYNSLRYRLKYAKNDTPLKGFLLNRFEKSPCTAKDVKKRMTLFGGWYMFAFAMVLSLTGFDLVMSMDPHWYSTLFGAYTFIKAIYAGFGALILVASIIHLTPSLPLSFSEKQLGDISTLFFGFSIVWGDFFYSQFVVIWYGNIPEETAYIIERTMTAPWNILAWTVFLVCFIAPFIILLNRKIKKTPKYMAIISGSVLTGLWIEHYLLLGPNYLDLHSGGFPISISDIIISLGFLSLMIISILLYFKALPEVLESDSGEVVKWK